MEREKKRPIVRIVGAIAFLGGAGLVGWLVVQGDADVWKQLVPSGAIGVTGLALVAPKVADRFLDALENFGFGE